MMEYPVKMGGLNPDTLAAWAEDEHGSWEDHGGPAGTARYLNGTLHVREILGRAKTVLILETPEEARAVLRSAGYHGDPSAWGDDRTAYRLAVGRIAERLRGLLGWERERL